MSLGPLPARKLRQARLAPCLKRCARAAKEAEVEGGPGAAAKLLSLATSSSSEVDVQLCAASLLGARHAEDAAMGEPEAFSALRRATCALLAPGKQAVGGGWHEGKLAAHTLFALCCSLDAVVRGEGPRALALQAGVREATARLAELEELQVAAVAKASAITCTAADKEAVEAVASEMKEQQAALRSRQRAAERSILRVGVVDPAAEAGALVRGAAAALSAAHAGLDAAEAAAQAEDGPGHHSAKQAAAALAAATAAVDACSARLAEAEEAPRQLLVPALLRGAEAGGRLLQLLCVSALQLLARSATARGTVARVHGVARVLGGLLCYPPLPAATARARVLAADALLQLSLDEGNARALLAGDGYDPLAAAQCVLNCVQCACDDAQGIASRCVAAASRLARVCASDGLAALPHGAAPVENAARLLGMGAPQLEAACVALYQLASARETREVLSGTDAMSRAFGWLALLLHVEDGGEESLQLAAAACQVDAADVPLVTAGLAHLGAEAAERLLGALVGLADRLLVDAQACADVPEVHGLAVLCAVLGSPAFPGRDRSKQLAICALWRACRRPSNATLLVAGMRVSVLDLLLELIVDAQNPGRLRLVAARFFFALCGEPSLAADEAARACVDETYDREGEFSVDACVLVLLGGTRYFPAQRFAAAQLAGAMRDARRRWALVELGALRVMLQVAERLSEAVGGGDGAPGAEEEAGSGGGAAALGALGHVLQGLELLAAERDNQVFICQQSLPLLLRFKEQRVGNAVMRRCVSAILAHLAGHTSNRTAIFRAELGAASGQARAQLPPAAAPAWQREPRSRWAPKPTLRGEYAAWFREQIALPGSASSVLAPEPARPPPIADSKPVPSLPALKGMLSKPTTQRWEELAPPPQSGGDSVLWEEPVSLSQWPEPPGADLFGECMPQHPPPWQLKVASLAPASLEV